MTTRKLKAGEVVEIDDSLPAIVVHGGDPTGLDGPVPAVVTARGHSHRIKARNWEPIDAGETNAADFVARPLDKTIAANRYASLYEQAVTEAAGSIDTNELEVQGEKAFKELVEEAFGKCPDCGQSVINWTNTTLTGVKIYNELSKLSNPEKIIREGIDEHLLNEAAKQAVQGVLQNLSSKQGLLDLEKNKHGEYVHASCSEGGTTPVQYDPNSLFGSPEDLM